MVALDDDARAYLELRRRSGSSLQADSLDPANLRDEERILSERYGHGPVMWAEALVPASHDLPRHYTLDPVEAPIGTILYIHGGGWVMGEPEHYLAVCRALAARSRWRVVVTDYAKAPEHPFPAGYTQCLRLAQVLLAGDAPRRGAGGGQGGDPSATPTGSPRGRLAIAGDSAGGGIAAAITDEISRSTPGALAAQILITPVLDSDLDRPSYRDPERQLSLTRSSMAWFFDQYAPPPIDRDDARIAPLRSPTLHSLPETLIVAAGTDVLAGEIEEYAEALAAANVGVRQRTFPGQMHGFFQLHNVMSSSLAAVSWIAEQLHELDASPERPTTKGWHP